MEGDSNKRETVTTMLGKPLSWYYVLQAEDDDLNDLEIMLKQDMYIR